MPLVLSRLGSASRRARAQWIWPAAVGLIAIAALAPQVIDSGPSARPSGCAEPDRWTPPQVKQARNKYLYRPLSDRGAAGCVTAAGKAVPANAEANNYVPSDGELDAYQSAKNANGDTPTQYDYYAKFVTGRPGILNPTTDQLIQWGSAKWGIPADWLRAQYTQESHWRQHAMGDLRTQTAKWRRRFPRFSCPTATRCYESLGITQVRWMPWNDDGTEPLRWKSTAFNIDYQAAKVRFFYDNPYGKRSAWGDSSYRPLDKWLSICGWFDPYPWGNADQRNYCSEVQKHLASRDWPSSRPGRRVPPLRLPPGWPRSQHGRLGIDVRVREHGRLRMPNELGPIRVDTQWGAGAGAGLRRTLRARPPRPEPQRQLEPLRASDRARRRLVIDAAGGAPPAVCTWA